MFDESEIPAVSQISMWTGVAHTRETFPRLQHLLLTMCSRIVDVWGNSAGPVDLVTYFYMSRHLEQTAIEGKMGHVQFPVAQAKAGLRFCGAVKGENPFHMDAFIPMSSWILNEKRLATNSMVVLLGPGNGTALIPVKAPSHEAPSKLVDLPI